MPQKLFISYPSESWNFAQRIAEKLAPQIEQAIFIDYRSIDRPDFAESILSHLRESDAVLLVVTEFTFADIHRDGDWVRLEICTALENGIPIVLVRENGLLPPRDLPVDVEAVQRSQGIPFYREFFDPGIALLTDFLFRSSLATPAPTVSAPVIIAPTPPPAATPPPEPQRTLGTAQALDEAADLLEQGDFEKALFLLNAVERGKVRPINLPILDDLLSHAEALRADFMRRREAGLDYDEIVRWSKRRLTEVKAHIAFTTWCQTYSDLVETLDTAELRRTFAPPPASPEVVASNPTNNTDLPDWFMGLEPALPSPPPTRKPTTTELLVPPFEWKEIPGGNGTMKTSDKNVTLTIPTERYWIAKYPVTNAQFAQFVKAGGYTTERWWTPAGWQQRQQDGWTQPRFWDNGDFNGAEQPVVGVSWSEAIAFCLWLKDVTGESVMLPTEAQWQYAAQGNDGRAYPWGKDWDGSRCNNSVGLYNSSKTTSVTEYAGKDKGDSPFGVSDMAGNVWEWCFTAYESGKSDLNGTDVRVLRGGSWNNNKAGHFRCDYRNWNDPDFRANNWGVSPCPLLIRF